MNDIEDTLTLIQKLPVFDLDSSPINQSHSIPLSTVRQFSCVCRFIHTGGGALYGFVGDTGKHIRAGQYKITRNRNKPLTYEEAQQPYQIGVTKSWNSWNTGNLDGEPLAAETGWEDIIIRKFMYGTWIHMFVCETIIKRRHNMIIVSGLLHQGLAPHKFYFLQGYTEEMLSYILKCPVKLEIQTVQNKRDVIFKLI